MHEPDPGSEQAMQTALAQELLAIHRESYGRGAVAARMYIHEDAAFCMLDGLELLPNEEFMIEQGHADAVIEIRGKYQAAIEATFRAAVERHTGRTVISFASVTKLDPSYAVEIFRLGPPSARDEALPSV